MGISAPAVLLLRTQGSLFISELLTYSITTSRIWFEKCFLQVFYSTVMQVRCDKRAHDLLEATLTSNILRFSLQTLLHIYSVCTPVGGICFCWNVRSLCVMYTNCTAQKNLEKNILNMDWIGSDRDSPSIHVKTSWPKSSSWRKISTGGSWGCLAWICYFKLAQHKDIYCLYGRKRGQG